MKTISTTAIVAVLTATLGLGAVAPAMAQSMSPPMAQPMGQPGMQHQMPNNMQKHMQQRGDGPHRQFNHDGARRPGGAGMLGGLLNFGRSSEQLEIALVRLSHRIDLTAEQKILLDTFKTAALAAQADFAKVIEANRPAATATATAEKPGIVARLGQRIALEKAHVDALTAVRPSFEAFFTSLTDAQKADLMPQQQRHTGWQRKGAAPAQLEAPAAPTAPAAPAVNG